MYFPLLLLVLASSAQCANILGVFLSPFYGHQFVFQKIWRELSLRGHQVTVFTPHPLNDPTLTNLTEISMRFARDMLEKTNFQELISTERSVYERTDNFHKFLDQVAEKELSSPEFQKLIKDENKRFDLVMIEFIHPVMYALADRFKAPSIAISSTTLLNPVYDAVGNPNHPVLYPDPILNFRPAKLSMVQKFQSILYFLWAKYEHHLVYVPRADRMARKYFGNGIPYIGDLERNVSMMFLNTNPILHVPRPNVPAIVEIGAMEIEPIATLPKDLQIFLDGAKKGAVYFSLGSTIKTSRLSKKIQNAILESLSELPYKILLKWDTDLPQKYPNILAKKWFPQSDVLAHPNIKLFVTQGSQQSVEQTIARKVPIVGIPFLNDQPSNIRRLVELGIGEKVDPSRLTKTILKNVINKVINTPRYKERTVEIEYILFDKPMTSLESAVWWAEYIIRHKGAWHLRSPAVDMPWYQYLLLDVILFLLTVALASIYIVYKLMKIVATLLFKVKAQKTVKKLKIG